MGYLLGVVAGILFVPAALIVGVIGLLIPVATVLLGRLAASLQTLMIGAMGGVGLGW
jgi:hypothetical protein